MQGTARFLPIPFPTSRRDGDQCLAGEHVCSLVGSLAKNMLAGYDPLFEAMGGLGP